MMLDIDSFPQPSEAFAWVQAREGPVLLCRPLSALTAHVFTTRPWALGSSASEIEDGDSWNAVAQAVDVDSHSLIRVRQVHGAGVLVAGSRDPGHPEADIVLASDPDLAVAVQSADCVPILFVDRRLGVVAAAHAGWRGLAARVPVEAVRALGAAFGSNPSDLYAAMGPAIGACCYQIGPDVVQAMMRPGFEAERLATYFLPAPVHSARNPSLTTLSTTPRIDRWFFDMWRATRDGLEEAGIPARQVFGAELCTASHPAVFCSYRRDGQSAGRMAAAIRPVRPRP